MVTVWFTPTTHTTRRAQEDPPPNMDQKFKILSYEFTAGGVNAILLVGFTSAGGVNAF